MLDIKNYNKLITAMLDNLMVKITFKNHVVPTFCYIKSLSALCCTITCNGGTFDISISSIKCVEI